MPLKTSNLVQIPIVRYGKKVKKNYNKYLSSTNHVKNFIRYLNHLGMRSHILVIN